MTLKEFFKTKTFKFNALAAVVITILLMVINMFALRIYTHHGESIQIPDLTGKNIAEVSSVLDNLDLRFEVGDSIYSMEARPGTVVDQFPKPGMKVKENRNILITLCAVNQEMIPMPQLTDISYRQAVNIIESSGLVTGDVEFQPSEFSNLVLDQKIDGKSIAVGEKVTKGSVVNLTIGGKSDGQASEVPTLFGHNLTDAKLALAEAFLNLGNVTYDESFTSEDEKIKGLIWRQSPDPADVFEVGIGTSVDIWMTIDTTKLVAKPKVEEPENSFF